MSFFAHLEDLRRAVVWSAVPILVATMFAFTFRLEFVSVGGLSLAFPRFAVYDNLATQIFNRARADLLPPDVLVVASGPTDAFFGLMCSAGVFGVIVGMPFVLFQLVQFIGPALRPRERRTASWAIVPAGLLFLLGSIFAYLFLLPFTYEFLFSYAAPITNLQWISVGDFMQFTVLFTLAFGFAFELPIIMALITAAGFVPAAAWREWWRIAAVGIFVFAAVITPDGTGVTMTLVAAPMLLLYGAGYLAAAQVERRREAETPSAARASGAA